MAWEDRPKGRVYYLSRRESGEVRKDYFGRGVAAALVSDAVEDRKSRKRARDCALAALKSALDVPDREAEAVEVYAALLFEAAMWLEGYHRHDRGAWRLRHGR